LLFARRTARAIPGGEPLGLYRYKVMEVCSNPRAFITVIGLDRAGIIACITGKLADLNFNILGISRTIMGDRFTMRGRVFQDHRASGTKRG